MRFFEASGTIREGWRKIASALQRLVSLKAVDGDDRFAGKPVRAIRNHAAFSPGSYKVWAHGTPRPSGRLLCIQDVGAMSWSSTWAVRSPWNVTLVGGGCIRSCCPRSLGASHQHRVGRTIQSPDPSTVRLRYLTTDQDSRAKTMMQKTSPSKMECSRPRLVQLTMSHARGHECSPRQQ